ncbi:MAG: hypothetical protein JST93_26275 [Acidobacteria bacterium]|nr:hypothetical protein [Acidobacteriota bacterium]
MILLILAIASLGAGLYSAIAYFLGAQSQQSYHNLLLGATLSWFVFATMWASRKPKP